MKTFKCLVWITAEDRETAESMVEQMCAFMHDAPAEIVFEPLEDTDDPPEE